MNSSTLRRLASEQYSIRRSPPPNYLFPPDQENASLPDDLSQLTILLTGSVGTPFGNGLWRLYLKIPTEYPRYPPRAIFRTRIYHPNVEETTGIVCLDTLQRGWNPKLTLRDILVTISCLLIHPNPDSALNPDAGALLQENYDAFAKQARLMTSIHAPIPKNLEEAVAEAKQRGEEDTKSLKPDRSNISRSPETSSGKRSLVEISSQKETTRVKETYISTGDQLDPLLAEDEEQEDDTKENDPSQPPPSITSSVFANRKTLLGKRPLSELPTVSDLDGESNLKPEKDGLDIGLTHPIDQAANVESDTSAEPLKKSPRLTKSFKGSDRIETRQEAVPINVISGLLSQSIETNVENEKENIGSSRYDSVDAISKVTKRGSSTGEPPRPTLRKVSNVGSSRSKGQARVGIRRL